jgi:hypothetical protein
MQWSGPRGQGCKAHYETDKRVKSRQKTRSAYMQALGDCFDTRPWRMSRAVNIPGVCLCTQQAGAWLAWRWLLHRSISVADHLGGVPVGKEAGVMPRRSPSRLWSLLAHPRLSSMNKGDTCSSVKVEMP